MGRLLVGGTRVEGVRSKWVLYPNPAFAARLLFACSSFALQAAESLPFLAVCQVVRDTVTSPDVTRDI